MSGIALQRCVRVVIALMLAFITRYAPADESRSRSGNDISKIKAKAEMGFAHEQMQLAFAYFTGDGVPQDAVQAARWYEMAAKAGDPVAENQIGYFNQTGIGVPVNLPRAAHWYQLAAASGLMEGEVNLAVAYLGGVGVPKDVQTARTLLEKAFHKGSGRAAAYLGEVYYFGYGVPADRTTAESWYEAGVKMHDALAGFRLGALYSGWEEHITDLHHAVELLRMSSDQGFLLSTHALAMILINHPELNKSTNAVHLLETCANAGNWKSSIALGILNRDGRFVAQDKKTAYFYFQSAARQGGNEAAALVAHDVASLKKTLRAEQQRDAEADADTWSAQHHELLLYIIKKHGKHDRPRDLAIIVAPAGSFAGGLIPIGAS
jgi:uncharacterized protein